MQDLPSDKKPGYWRRLDFVLGLFHLHFDRIAVKITTFPEIPGWILVEGPYV